MMINHDVPVWMNKPSPAIIVVGSTHTRITFQGHCRRWSKSNHPRHAKSSDLKSRTDGRRHLEVIFSKLMGSER